VSNLGLLVAALSSYCIAFFLSLHIRASSLPDFLYKLLFFLFYWFFSQICLFSIFLNNINIFFLPTQVSKIKIKYKKILFDGSTRQFTYPPINEVG
jgi:hypothetical protein